MIIYRTNQYTLTPYNKEAYKWKLKLAKKGKLNPVKGNPMNDAIINIVNEMKKKGDDSIENAMKGYNLIDNLHKPGRKYESLLEEAKKKREFVEKYNRGEIF